MTSHYFLINDTSQQSSHGKRLICHQFGQFQSALGYNLLVHS